MTSLFEYLSTRAPLPAAARTETALRLALQGPAARPARAEQCVEKAAMCAAIASSKHAAQDAGTEVAAENPVLTLLGFSGPKQRSRKRAGKTIH